MPPCCNKYFSQWRCQPHKRDISHLLQPKKNWRLLVEQRLQGSWGSIDIKLRQAHSLFHCVYESQIERKLCFPTDLTTPLTPLTMFICLRNVRDLFWVRKVPLLYCPLHSAVNTAAKEIKCCSSVWHWIRDESLDSCRAQFSALFIILGWNEQLHSPNEYILGRIFLRTEESNISKEWNNSKPRKCYKFTHCLPWANYKSKIIFELIFFAYVTSSDCSLSA